jgi:glycine/D-amino acid oxidase-like deaminating enzyme
MQQIECDLAVVGSGIIGASCAYQAAKRGLKVAIIDEQTPAAGTSGACDGYVSISSKKPGLVMALAAASKRIYPELVKELPVDPEYMPSGGMLVVEDPNDMGKLEAHVAALAEFDVPMQWLDRAAMLKHEPHLSPNLYGAFRCPVEAIVNPYLMTLGLVGGAVTNGARTFWGAKPTHFDLTGGRITRMETTAGRVVAEQYLFCAGVWSQELGRMVGLDLPVIPRRGELVVTERGANLATHYLMSAKYLVAKADPDAAKTSTDPLVRLGHGFCLEVNAQGQCIIGSTRSFVGHDRRTTPEGIAAIVTEAVKRIPALARVQVLRVFAGLRPYVNDKKPIIGRSGRVTNLLVAAGHEGDGICLSAITGALIADLATGRQPELDISELTPDRFPPPNQAAAA